MQTILINNNKHEETSSDFHRDEVKAEKSIPFRNKITFIVDLVCFRIPVINSMKLTILKIPRIQIRAMKITSTLDLLIF